MTVPELNAHRKAVDEEIEKKKTNFAKVMKKKQNEEFMKALTSTYGDISEMIDLSK